MKLRTIFPILSTLVILVGACGRSPRMIEEDKLKQIITEALITDAVRNHNRTSDTVDYYTPILTKAGYTMQDLQYTIAEMAGRKSNPLNNMFDTIKSTIGNIASHAQWRFRMKQQYDSAAIAFTTDTVYRKDTMIVGSLGRYKFSLAAPKAGIYTVSFTYQSHNSYDVGTRQMNLHLPAYDTLQTINQTAWISRAFTPTPYRYDLEIPADGYSSLDISFTDPTLMKVARDTSYVKQIRVSYRPELSTARREYFRKVTSIELNPKTKPDNELQLNWYRLPSDSLPRPPYAGRQHRP